MAEYILRASLPSRGDLYVYVYENRYSPQMVEMANNKQK